MERTTRRQVLATTGVALATGIAGCASNGEGTETGGDVGEETTEGGEMTTEGGEETTPDEETTTPGEETTTGSGATSVVVGPNGEFRFSPSSVTVATGDAVEWVWSSGGHNIVVDSQPDGADWQGTEGDAGTVHDAGHEYSHTFETAGTYAYYCNPHRASGMTGEVVVE